MANELIAGYAQALFQVVKAEDELDRVEDELFRVAKLLETNHELKQTLADQSIDVHQREKVIEELIGDKVDPHTRGLIKFIVAQGRARHLPQILEHVAELAAEARQSVIAEVRSAIPLDEKQQEQLAKALSKATGKKVEVKVIVDPSVLGGVVAKVGDTVIDGTVRKRLEELKEQVR